MNEPSTFTKSAKAKNALVDSTCITIGSSIVGLTIQTAFPLLSFAVMALGFGLIAISFVVYGIVVWREVAEQKEARDKKYAEADAYLFGPKDSNKTSG